MAARELGTLRSHEIDVVIPEDHRITVDVPETIRSGPARLILLVPAEGDQDRGEIELSAETQRSLWREWEERGPQGPIEIEDGSLTPGPAPH